MAAYAVLNGQLPKPSYAWSYVARAASGTRTGRCQKPRSMLTLVGLHQMGPPPGYTICEYPGTFNAVFQADGWPARP